MPRLRFITHLTRGNREHKVSEEDVRFVLNRLPGETWSFLREVHFNDRIGQRGCLGYACHRSHSLALCALPSRLSFARYCHRQECRPEVCSPCRQADRPTAAVFPVRRWPESSPTIGVNSSGPTPSLSRKTRFIALPPCRNAAVRMPVHSCFSGEISCCDETRAPNAPNGSRSWPGSCLRNEYQNARETRPRPGSGGNCAGC